MSTVPKLARRAISYGSVKVTATPKLGQSQRQADIDLCGRIGMWLIIHKKWEEDQIKIVGRELCLMAYGKWVFPGKKANGKPPTRKLNDKEWNQFWVDIR